MPPHDDPLRTAETIGAVAWLGSIAIWYITEKSWPEFCAWYNGEFHDAAPDDRKMSGEAWEPLSDKYQGIDWQRVDAGGRYLHDLAEFSEAAAVATLESMVNATLEP